MADNFEKITENLTEPSRVRNFLRDAINDAERKQYSPLFHTVYALLCALVVYLAADPQQIPIVSSLSFILLCVAPGMCVFTFLYSPMYLKALPVALPLLAILVRQAASGFEGGFLAAASVLFVYILCILSAAIITKAVISGYTKTTLFTALSVVFGIICFCQIVFVFVSSFGTFSFGLLLDTINSSMQKLVETTVEYAQSPEGLAAFRSINVSENPLSDAELSELVRKSMQLLIDTTKPLLPSFFAFSCMLYGFVCVAFFSLFAKHFRINVFVSIMDNSWTYRLSLVSTTVYDIVFFAFILSMFINMPQNISITVINLMLVLTPLMFVSGIKGIYSMLFRRFKNKANSALVTAIIFAVALMITGAVAILITGSVGVTFVAARNREERVVVPIKYAADLALLKKMSESQPSESDNQSTPDENQ